MDVNTFEHSEEYSGTYNGMNDKCADSNLISLSSQRMAAQGMRRLSGRGVERQTTALRRFI